MAAIDWFIPSFLRDEHRRQAETWSEVSLAAVAREVVVWVESEGAGKGSTFLFTLPESDAGAGGRRRRPPG